MKTTLDDTTKILIGLQRGMGQKLTKYIENKVASDLVARVKLRVQERGISATGKPFKAYSTKQCLLGWSNEPKPVFNKVFKQLWAQNKKTGKRNKRLGKKKGNERLSAMLAYSQGNNNNWVTVGPDSATTISGNLRHNVHLLKVQGGYRQMRSLAGYQTGHKDFMLTGSMWRGVGVKSVKLSGLMIFITYGTKDDLTAQKVLGHNKREGVDILAPAKIELLEESNLIIKWLSDYLQELFK